MARSKNSPALFEVIRNAQQKQREQLERQRQQLLHPDEASPAAALLRSPLYWFKGKQAHEQVHGAPAKPVTREVSKPPAVTADLRRTAAIENPVQDSVVQDSVEEEAVWTEAPLPAAPPLEAVPSTFASETARQVREELAAQEAVPYDVAAQEAPAAEPFFDAEIVAPVGARSDSRRNAPVEVPAAAVSGIDNYLNERPADPANPRSPGQFALNFSYTGAALAGFSILVALTIVYIVGASRPSAKPEQIALNPAVTEISRPKPPAADPAPPTEAGPRARPETPNAPLTFSPGKPIAVPTDVKRTGGMQYLVLLSSPRGSDAQDLVKFLAKNGIPATAEKALPEYSPSWYSVVTTRGFERTHNNPECDAYVKDLSRLMGEYANGSKFKNFKPDVYTWRGN